VRVHQFIVIIALALADVLPAHADKRVALVIGNDSYANLPAAEQLQKAVNDARAVGKALESLGFEVMSGENAGRLALVDKLDAFARRLAPGDTAFFFFSGHGVSMGGANYILPADVPNVEADQETRLARVALSEHDLVLDLQSRGVRVAVVVLDACRTNPFARPGAKGVGGERGLAPPPPVKGVFSLYAASAGQAARDRLSDGDRNPNSVFSRVLVPALTKPDLDLTALAFDVREEVARVAKAAGYVQEPAYYDGTIGGRVYLAGAPPVREQGQDRPMVTTTVSDAERTWGIIQNTTSLAALDDYIRQYGNVPIYGPLARARRDEVAKRQVAATIEPARPDLPRPDQPLTAAQERGLKPKDTFRECTGCPEMVVVPAGSFTMGSPKTEKGHESNEDPQHVVTIDRLFAAGKLHVTVDQFAAFVQETQHKASPNCRVYEKRTWSDRKDRSWRNPGFTQEGSHPVVCVSWDDASAYAEWLAKKTGKPYRLLSEAEWEYAARGQTSPGAYPRFWFGDDEKEICRYGNSADQQARTAAAADGDAPCNDGYAYTSPAGNYAPNAFGLYDMAGNAWQWTADCYHDSYNGAPDNGSAWRDGACQGSGHVWRGGPWHWLTNDLRAARRFSPTVHANANAQNYTGFRIARTLAP
jgi:formylglycine-generating enzyme required for sulfatase activity